MFPHSAPHIGHRNLPGGKMGKSEARMPGHGKEVVPRTSGAGVGGREGWVLS